MIVDDEGSEEQLQEGRCDMCQRQKLLTFHHLIPKDVHATYLKKRLPPGIDGEPTKLFLNSYGTMVCRQCHAFIHRLVPNPELAKDFNTLQKILDNPKVQLEISRGIVKSYWHCLLGIWGCRVGSSGRASRTAADNRQGSWRLHRARLEITPSRAPASIPSTPLCS
mmetsp:Transcript_79414/g.256714  ORF Transcript_79414/g.256714 Transcript_79414/m.256714 type:complete len:166 (-) Transcript_79414:51-548(-)